MSKDDEFHLMWALIILLGACVLVQFFNQERLSDTIHRELQEIKTSK